MELQEIKNLLLKYEAGETNLAEEQMLREYFSRQDVLPSLAHYKILFGYTALAKQISYQEKVKPVSQKNTYVWFAVAASLILLLGLFFYQDSSFNTREGELGTIQDSEMAMEKTRETLKMVSEIMNDGKEDLVYLKEFNNTKDKFIKTN